MHPDEFAGIDIEAKTDEINQQSTLDHALALMFVRLKLPLHHIEMDTVTQTTTAPIIYDTEMLDFFDVVIEQDQEQANLADNVKILAEYFASSNKSLELLLDPKFAPVKKLFIKYNTKLLSSAACERLFSIAKHILTASRTLLGDEKFEKLLILKCSDLLNG